MRFNLFPHYPRKISARWRRRLEKLGRWGILLAVLAINGYAKINLGPDYWDKLELALSRPYSPTVHVALAQTLWQEGLWGPARDELVLAQDYWKPSLAPSGNPLVLGVTSSPADLLSYWQNLPVELRQQYSSWQEVLKEKPDYVDAYIQLGALGYQLFRDSQAKLYLEKALTLDPNSAMAQKLLVLVSHAQQ